MSDPIRLLVVDDSAFNRRSIAELFADADEVEVVGKAADGEEALKLVTLLRPDAITLDLEMPRMDGFTFLRILMSKLPTPVIVVSSYSQKENVFKALELGALDFVAKPDRRLDAELAGIREELLQKIKLVRTLRAQALTARIGRITTSPGTPPPVSSPRIPPRHLVAIASSTGGPSALLELLSNLPPKPNVALLIAQHMPDKFTRTFADRLDRRSTLRVSEANDGDEVTLGTAFVCPGKRCMELEMDPQTGVLRLQVGMPQDDDRYVPSADRLFRSVARAYGSRAIGIILTGMGDDGVAGAKAVLAARGTVVAESAETAVVYGMPGAAVRADAVTRTLPLRGIGDWLAELALKQTLPR